MVSLLCDSWAGPPLVAGSVEALSPYVPTMIRELGAWAWPGAVGRRWCLWDLFPESQLYLGGKSLGGPGLGSREVKAVWCPGSR